MIGLDTNVLARYLAQNEPAPTARATRLIEKECSAEAPGFISLIVLVETVWVSEICYQSDRAEIGEIVRRILSSRQLRTQESEQAWRALRLYESSKAEFADCLALCLAQAAGCERMATFDKQAAQAGMALLK